MFFIKITILGHSVIQILVLLLLLPPLPLLKGKDNKLKFKKTQNYKEEKTYTTVYSLKKYFLAFDHWLFKLP